MLAPLPAAADASAQASAAAVMGIVEAAKVQCAPHRRRKLVLCSVARMCCVLRAALRKQHSIICAWQQPEFPIATCTRRQEHRRCGA